MDQPFLTFQTWYAEAAAREVDPARVVLATADAHARPAARCVYFRGMVDSCLSFYTNYTSRKGRELAENPHAAMLFHWQQPNRQIRVEGPVRKMDQAGSAAYFAARERASQLAAWASHQSDTLTGRDQLEARFAERERQFAGREVPLPEFWGGYLLTPEYFEFWESRPHRMHERICWTRTGQAWARAMLSP